MTSDKKNADRKTIAQFFTLLGEGRIPEWLALIHDDISVETPLAAKGSPTVFKGIDEIKTRFGDARQDMASLVFLDVDIQPMVADGRWVVTCRSEGSFDGGVRYKNTYCWLFGMEDGRIKSWVEFFDPQETIAVAEALAAQE